MLLLGLVLTFSGCATTKSVVEFSVDREAFKNDARVRASYRLESTF